MNAFGYVHGMPSEADVKLSGIMGLKVRYLFVYDMYSTSRSALVHIRGEDTIGRDGRGKLFRVSVYPCASAGRDIELKRYQKPTLPPSCSEFLRGVSQAWRGVVQSFGGVSCSEF